MSQEKSYKKLIVWQNGYRFILEVYRLSKTFPKYEQYGITSQLRRAAVSVIANIVEGQAKNSRKDFLRYLNIAKGSIRECEFLLELAHDLGYLSREDYNHLEELQAKTAYLLHRLTLSLQQ